jgi:PadR family transcriptional regulator AphA
MDEARLSLTEHTVLALLAEGRTHGFAISRELVPGGDIGRVLTVRRSLVYRALDRLVALGLAEPVKTEPGDAGPQRVVHSITPSGEDRLQRWLEEPVRHVRDIRLAFLLKTTLLLRADRSPLPLIRAQREALTATLAAFESSAATTDPVELWRRHNASAAAAYLADMEAIYGG